MELSNCILCYDNEHPLLLLDCCRCFRRRLRTSTRRHSTSPWCVAHALDEMCAYSRLVSRLTATLLTRSVRQKCRRLLVRGVDAPHHISSFLTPPHQETIAPSSQSRSPCFILSLHTASSYRLSTSQRCVLGSTSVPPLRPLATQHPALSQPPA
eukprot:5925707-Pleurochrysis_carterae.AAC.2